MIGGQICHEAVQADQFVTEGPVPSPDEFHEALWPLFVAIGECWSTSSSLSAEMRSRWREFISEKVSRAPSYAAEYTNAVSVLAELREIFGDRLYEKLFLQNGIPDGPCVTRLAHAKRFVVDEFIRVHVSSGGFRSFGARNYRGWVSGSRVASQAPYRIFDDEFGVQ